MSCGVGFVRKPLLVPDSSSRRLPHVHSTDESVTAHQVYNSHSIALTPRSLCVSVSFTRVIWNLTGSFRSPKARPIIFTRNFPWERSPLLNRGLDNCSPHAWINGKDYARARVNSIVCLTVSELLYEALRTG
jgi:hypothetical protein